MKKVYRNLDVDCIDAVDMNKKHPKTFEFQRLEDIINADEVKICRNNERFWVLVEKIHKGVVYGKVDNRLISNPDLKLGMNISFQINKVFGTLN